MLVGGLRRQVLKGIIRLWDTGMGSRALRPVAMTTETTTDAPAQSFYLPAVPTLSAEPGAVERLLTRLYDSHRRFLRQME